MTISKELEETIQNAFALTVHKTQGLTLPHTSLTVDENVFAAGQVYVAMSRVPSWESVDTLTFDFDHLKVDEHIIAEYWRLACLSRRGLGDH